MRRALIAGLAALLLPAGAGATTLELRFDPAAARPGATVTFSARLFPAQAGVPVGLYARTGTTWSLVASQTTAADGTAPFRRRVSRPGAYLALATLDPATTLRSAEVALRIRPLLAARVVGRRIVGERLRLRGRLRPAAAGTLTLTLGGTARRVRAGPSGRFTARIPSELPGRRGWRVALAPNPGYEQAARRGGLAIGARALALGSAGPSVRALETRLARLRYVLRSVDSTYRSDTYEAVLAFQKVHGLRRTGAVTRGLWRRLARARAPRALSPRGTHVEVSKTKQVMFEVVRGKVVRAVHVSTGATGNTPVGRWRVYRLDSGYNAIGMYYSLYFLRGFAIHGYRSVPPYPASHGCVRTPLWFARGFYERWGRLGTRILVFP